MHDSITMAEVGSIKKVIDSRIATPLGPPRPGSTPTNTPRMRPTNIRPRIFQLSSTEKPWSRSEKASICSPFSVAEQGFERPLRHDDVKLDFEDEEHGEREDQRRQQP